MSQQFIDAACAAVNRATGQLVQGELTGSTYVHGAGNDIDVLVWPIGQWKDWENIWFALTADGLKMDCSYQDAGEYFMSCRMEGNVNVIVASSAEVARDISQATEVCRGLSMLYGRERLNKQGRVLIHRIIRDGMDADEAFATATRDVPMEAP